MAKADLQVDLVVNARPAIERLEQLRAERRARALAGGPGYALVRAEDGDAAAPDDVKAEPGKPVLYIYDVIGFDPWAGGGITAKQVLEDLAQLGDVERLQVRVNSPGGDVFEGISIYNALARFKAPVTVHVDGLAASAASLIAMAGDEIRIAENAMYMVHRAYTLAVGDAGEMRRTASLLDKVWTGMLATYARRTGRRGETLDKRVEDAGGEWWLTAAEAVAEGFADEVVAPERDAEVFGLAQFRQVPERLAAAASWEPPAPPRPGLQVAEIAAPRVTRAAHPDDAAAAARRRVVDVARLSG